MALTDVKCRGAKPGKTRVKLSDGGGLQFWVQPNGSRLWQLVYQYQGKQAQMALGPYPQVTLIEARALREEAKSKIRAGIDPTAEKRRVEVLKAAPGDTLARLQWATNPIRYFSSPTRQRLSTAGISGLFLRAMSSKGSHHYGPSEPVLRLRAHHFGAVFAVRHIRASRYRRRAMEAHGGQSRLDFCAAGGLVECRHGARKWRQNRPRRQANHVRSGDNGADAGDAAHL